VLSQGEPELVGAELMLQQLKQTPQAGLRWVVAILWETLATNKVGLHQRLQ
jgi:hypothetical protein